MKKISYILLITITLLLFSCSNDRSDNKLTLDDYKIYKTFIEDSEWYKDLLQKTGKNKIEFRKLDNSELNEPIILDNKETYNRQFEDKYVFSPNKNMVLDSYSYGLELDVNNNEIRDVDTALYLYDIKNNKSAPVFFVGPSGKIEFTTWIDDNSFIAITSDQETEQKMNFAITVYKVDNDKISKISEFSGETFLN